jgi:carbohydrate kinase (thermoresistant glucokinase family)
MGVSGSGKTTIGRLLSHQTGIPFFDGDDFHAAANKEKMKAGIPLTDEDRMGWLQQLHALAKKQSTGKGAIIACSALKEKYRQLLSAHVHKPVWVFLTGSFELIEQRLKNRASHFMPAVLLQSQFDALEIPQDVFTVEVNQEPEAITDRILELLKKQPMQH